MIDGRLHLQGRDGALERYVQRQRDSHSDTSSSIDLHSGKKRRSRGRFAYTPKHRTIRKLRRFHNLSINPFRMKMP